MSQPDDRAAALDAARDNAEQALKDAETLARLEAGGLDETTETWTPLTDGELLERHNQRTQLVDDQEQLTPFACELLEFEQGWWKFPAVKESTIRDRWDLSPTRYYQLLNTLIDIPAAKVHDPMTVKRLTAMRDTRRGHRNPTHETGSER